MKQFKMTFRDYPMFCYFMNMFTSVQQPPYTLSIEGPTPDVPITLSFYAEEPDGESIKKMCATAYGLDFSISDIDFNIEPQFQTGSITV